MATTVEFNEKTKAELVGKTIVSVGHNSITLDCGTTIYIEESDISYLNSFNEEEQEN